MSKTLIRFLVCFGFALVLAGCPVRTNPNAPGFFDGQLMTGAVNVPEHQKG